jgi:hypothetical protein
MSERIIALVSVVVFFALNAAAQNNLDKPYDTWSRVDVIKILSDSPWAKTHQVSQPSSTLSDAPTTGATKSNTPAQQRSRDTVIPPVVVRLHSARPIREAVVRLQQIDGGYDKMSDADKKTFDDAHQKFLDCAVCTDYYVVTVFKFTTGRGAGGQALFDGMTTADLKGKVKLVNDNGQERELAEFNPPKNARDMAVFYFKRTEDGGVSLVAEDSKEVRLVFTKEFLSSKKPFAALLPANTSFKVSKMIVGGKLLF